MELPARFAPFVREGALVSFRRALSREEASGALERARMAVHEAALEMEAEIGGLAVGDFQLGIGSIATTPDS